VHVLALISTRARCYCRLYTFDGYAQCAGAPRQPLDASQLLLRGCVLRKTPWVVGVAVNVGRDCKIVQNMTKAPRKARRASMHAVAIGCWTFLPIPLCVFVHYLHNALGPTSYCRACYRTPSPFINWDTLREPLLLKQVTQLEQAMNILVYIQFGTLVVVCAVLAGLDYWWNVRAHSSSLWYLPSLDQYPELPPGVAAYFISVCESVWQKPGLIHSADVDLLVHLCSQDAICVYAWANVPLILLYSQGIRDSHHLLQHAAPFVQFFPLTCLSFYWWRLKTLGPPPNCNITSLQFLRFLILLNNMIPISLYVTLEVVKVFQCTLLLNSDRAMYHRDTDTPFVCRSTALNEELGQVRHDCHLQRCRLLYQAHTTHSCPCSHACRAAAQIHIRTHTCRFSTY
jgi:hypothetical protein